MLAFAIILVEFVLSGRFRSVSAKIGMDVTMRFHQLLARTALVLAMFHPFLYGSEFNLPYPFDPTRQLTLTRDIASLSSGVLAFVLLPAFVILSIGRDSLPYKYETWRLMHGLGAVAISGALLHHTVSAGRYGQLPALETLWTVLAGLAGVSLIYVYLLKPMMLARAPWRVSRVQKAGERTWEIDLEPDGHPGLRYKAGQFAWLNIANSAFSLRENPFSISSAPGAGKTLSFLIKELGDFTSTIGQVAPETRAYVDGPHGSLVVTGRKEPGIAFIAGGVGLAPLLGILRQMRLERDGRPTLLIYGNRKAEQIVHPQELEALATELGTEIVLVLSEPPEGWSGRTGMIDAALVESIFREPEMRDWLFVMCGPGEMMETVEDALIAKGVPTRQILSERFRYD
ncbi:ferredoxin reductase family protein [Rhizobiales bacterium]|uniref:ferredoxin reductase family protein n=1 Tax=Hongsoonwoonella zoysiae TaxID=2821844 RepID=UPI00155FE784|nr:ferredoxin reductase family protein [Hongsoonwoonella zoysiae]NRG16519.1 ferredoxin reductase family protein [Hongsoonwoonella zoysiae]